VNKIQDAGAVGGVREASDPDEGVLVVGHRERSHHVHAHLPVQGDDDLVHVADELCAAAGSGVLRADLVEHRCSLRGHGQDRAVLRAAASA
jgi:hypothetical protein